MDENQYLNLLLKNNELIISDIKLLTGDKKFISSNNDKKDNLLKKIGKKYDVDMMFIPNNSYDLINLMKVTDKKNFYGIELRVSKEGLISYPVFCIRNNVVGSVISIGEDYILLKENTGMVFNLESKKITYNSQNHELSSKLNKNAEIFNNYFDSILHSIMSNKGIPEEVKTFIKILNDEDVPEPISIKFEAFTIQTPETIIKRIKNRLIS